MGILWLLAEGLIMVYVRKGYRVLTDGDARQRGFVVFCLAAFIFLAFLRLAKVLGLDALSSAGGSLFSFRYYNGYVWNLYCTLWVVIEGVIAVYIFRIYKLLDAAVSGGAADRPDRNDPARGWGPPALTLISLAVFTGYHGYLLHLMGGADLRSSAVYNLLRFYIKLCGVFWILFEWYVAVAGIKMFLLLKRIRRGADPVD